VATSTAGGGGGGPAAAAASAAEAAAAAAAATAPASGPEQLDPEQGLVDEMGAKLLFLAPYCFIDAPIEVGFGQWKRWLNRHQDFDNF